MERRRSDRGARVLPFPVTRAFVAALAALLILAPAAVAQDLPMDLPGDATASSVRADPDTWLVGARARAASAKIAKRFDADATSGSRPAATASSAAGRARSPPR